MTTFTFAFFSAKHPYLQLRNPSIKEGGEHGDPVLCFGSVAIGKSLQKHLDIINPSPVGIVYIYKQIQMHIQSGLLSHLSFCDLHHQVTVSFSLSQTSNGIPLCGSEFTCDITRGKLAPGGTLHATVTYSPAVVDTISVEYLSLKYKEELYDTQTLKLTGKCIGKSHVHLKTIFVLSS